MKKIPKKNYIILFVILIITVGLTFYARQWYITSKEYYARNSVIKEVVYEINENEIYSYTTEKPKFILYASSGTDIDIKKFEGKLKKLITKYEMNDDVVYLNLDNVDINAFTVNLKNNFTNKNNSISNNSLSTFYIFQNGKIIMTINNVNDYPEKYLVNLFKEWRNNNG